MLLIVTTISVQEGFTKEWKSPVPYVALALMVVTAIGSMIFVNKAMMLFGNSVVCVFLHVWRITCHIVFGSMVGTGSSFAADFDRRMTCG